MCGIVGAVAQRDVGQILLEGLKRLEYRGYDSAGLAILHPQTSSIQRLRVQGKVASLASEFEKNAFKGSLGIAHTRWATHGQPTTENAHPHISSDEIAIVHNGIIENHDQVRKKLTGYGYQFSSQTDTEVVVHLIHYYFSEMKDLFAAIQRAAKELIGAFALGVISTRQNTLYALRQGSPLVIGLGIGENYIASDALALLPVTQQFIFLEEGDVAQINIDKVSLFDANGKMLNRKIHVSTLDDARVSKGNYRHFMQKEIFEQPRAILETLEGHVINGKILPQSFGYQAENIFKKIKRIQLVACGTSYHAALIGKQWLEELAEIPCQVEIASENRYRKGVVEENTLLVVLSQSGETADTLAVLRQSKTRGYVASLGICNVSESSLVREADLVFLTRAGLEVGVAATKTFTTQLVALLLFSLTLRQLSFKDDAVSQQIIDSLKNLPVFMNQTLELDPLIKEWSYQFNDKKHALFLGRGLHFPIALEGALKLKEISYIHAEGYPAGELKHGPLALVDKDLPIVVLAPKDHLVEKLASNIQEISARGGELFVLQDQHLDFASAVSMHTLSMPTVPSYISPIVYTIPLQLLAYHVAVLKGTDVDQPRNLAKSVTVE